MKKLFRQNSLTYNYTTLHQEFIWFWVSNFISDIDECLMFPCFHEGNCTNTDGSFTCNCSAGWTGFQCQTGNKMFYCLTLYMWHSLIQNKIKFSMCLIIRRWFLIITRLCLPRQVDAHAQPTNKYFEIPKYYYFETEIKLCQGKYSKKLLISTTFLRQNSR